MSAPQRRDRSILKWFMVGLGLFILLASPALLREVQAQSREPWTPLMRLSSLAGESSEAAIIADDFGYVHAFWSETGFEHERRLINYSRFDGSAWTTPSVIYAAWPGTLIDSVTADVDREGIIHLAWAEGSNGPVMYSRVAMADAFSAKEWEVPIRIDLEALRLEMFVNGQGMIHIVYANFNGETPGIYHTTSANDGKAWSYPVWIDPDIPASAAPSWLDADMDEQGGLHLVWSYSDQNLGFISRWVRYSNSFDGGKTWSEPFSIDLAQETVDELRMPNPGIVTTGDQVHVVWAGTADTHREHRYSADRGETWSETEQLFGNLLGQAIGDGLAVDSRGALHFTGQLRYPMAVHHAIWHEDSWSDPEIAYFIKEDSVDDTQGQIGAHNVRLAIRAGNQLVMSFTTSPQDQQQVLYVMHATLDGVPELAPHMSPTPTPAPTLTPPPPAESPTPSPTPPNPAILEGDPSAGSLGQSFFYGFIASLLFVFSIIAVRILRSR